MTSAVRRAGIAAGALAFALAATANAGGYRYGASDQAFYIPAIRNAMDPSLFPRDSWLLAAQGRVILWDGLVAGVTAVSQLPLPWVFFILYLAGVAALYASALFLARTAGMTPWATTAMLAALTLRHRIARTGVNTLEGYLHPRMIAFPLGVLALATFLRRKPAWAAVALAAAFAIHPTTGLWFGMLLGVAAFVAWPRWRVTLAAVAIAGAAAAVWAMLAGPLASRAVVMDTAWLSAVETKDYLFPHEWPAYAWAFNFLPAIVVAAAFLRMRDLSDEMRGLLAGALALVAFFLATLPFVTMRYALAVQMQIPRVFWLVELVALVVLCFAISRRPSRFRTFPLAAAVAGLIIVLSLARGAVIVMGEKDGRLVTVNLARGDWTDAMLWLRAQPVDVHVLAGADHAGRFGSSVRVSAERDVFTEDVKDAALAMYDRDVAMRVIERRALLTDLASTSADDLLQLARQYDLDYLVTDLRFALPVKYENASFRIYGLAESREP